jgi:hypothetical protein
MLLVLYGVGHLEGGLIQFRLACKWSIRRTKWPQKGVIYWGGFYWRESYSKGILYTPFTGTRRLRVLKPKVSCMRMSNNRIPLYVDIDLKLKNLLRSKLENSYFYFQHFLIKQYNFTSIPWFFVNIFHWSTKLWFTHPLRIKILIIIAFTRF